jgi:hypothetical protein
VSVVLAFTNITKQASSKLPTLREPVKVPTDAMPSAQLELPSAQYVLGTDPVAVGTYWPSAQHLVSTAHRNNAV